MTTTTTPPTTEASAAMTDLVELMDRATGAGIDSVARIPSVPAGRINAKAMAGSFAASRGPVLRVADVLHLRALSALARADLRSRSTGATFSPVTELTGDELAILAEGGWTEVPVLVTRFDTLRVSFAELDDQVRAGWLAAIYLLTVAGYPTREYMGWDEPDLEVLADLPDLLAGCRFGFTERQLRWFLEG